MKSLALLTLSVAFFAVAPAAASGHGGHGGHHGFSGHPGHSGGRFAHHPHFRFHGHPFIVVGGPLFVAPWLAYPYTWDGPWGPRYYVPEQGGYFLYYCPDPAGYYPDVRDCPAGWLRVVPEPSSGIDY